MGATSPMRASSRAKCPIRSHLTVALGKPRPIRTSDVVYGICRGLPLTVDESERIGHLAREDAMRANYMVKFNS